MLQYKGRRKRLEGDQFSADLNTPIENTIFFKEVLA